MTTGFIQAFLNTQAVQDRIAAIEKHIASYSSSSRDGYVKTGEVPYSGCAVKKICDDAAIEIPEELAAHLDDIFIFHFREDRIEFLSVKDS